MADQAPQKAGGLTVAAHGKVLAILERMTGTDHAGEAVACVEALRRLRERHGWAWSDVLRPPRGGEIGEDWRAVVRTLMGYPEVMNFRDLEFLHCVVTRRDPPTEKQARWMRSLVERVRAAGGNV
jgi:hypothetical protein